MPRSRATCAIGRLLSNSRRAPRSSSSGGYFLGRGISTASLPLPRTRSSFRGLRQTQPASQIAREILREAGEIDQREDDLYGDSRGDELPEQLRTREGRRRALP